MKLSRTVAYALQATLQLAARNSSNPVPCSQLASEGQMPERFLLQVLRSLVTHGILESTRGVEGGYTLNRDPSEISLLDIIEAIEGPVQASMPSSAQLPTGLQQPISTAIEGLADTMRRELESIKLASLIPPPPAPPTTDRQIGPSDRDPLNNGPNHGEPS